MKLHLWFLPTVFLSGSPAFASEDEQLWTSANVTAAVADGVKVQNELVLRFSDNRRGLYEMENTTVLGVQVAKDVTVWGGYVHNPQYDGGNFTRMERRARQQLTFDNVARIGNGKVNARLRVEQRWRDGMDGTGWRLRPYVRYSVGIAKKATLALSHETFLNLNTTTFQVADGWERMRNQVAVQLPIARGLNFDVGYLNQYRAVRGGEDTIDHAATVGLSLSI